MSELTVIRPGIVSLHFGVIVAGAPGSYTNQASATASGDFTVAPTGATALVTVQAGGTRLLRYARTASSYLSQGDRRLHFGLGSAPAIDRVVVRWPGRRGFTEEFVSVPADHFVTLEQGKGKRLP